MNRKRGRSPQLPRDVEVECLIVSVDMQSIGKIIDCKIKSKATCVLIVQCYHVSYSLAFSV